MTKHKNPSKRLPARQRQGRVQHLHDQAIHQSRINNLRAVELDGREALLADNEHTQSELQDYMCLRCYHDPGSERCICKLPAPDLSSEESTLVENITALLEPYPTEDDTQPAERADDDVEDHEDETWDIVSRDGYYGSEEAGHRVDEQSEPRTAPMRRSWEGLQTLSIRLRCREADVTWREQQVEGRERLATRMLRDREEGKGEKGEKGEQYDADDEWSEVGRYNWSGWEWVEREDDGDGDGEEKLSQSQRSMGGEEEGGRLATSTTPGGLETIVEAEEAEDAARAVPSETGNGASGGKRLLCHRRLSRPFSDRLETDGTDEHDDEEGVVGPDLTQSVAFNAAYGKQDDS